MKMAQLRCVTMLSGRAGQDGMMDLKAQLTRSSEAGTSSAPWRQILINVSTCVHPILGPASQSLELQTRVREDFTITIESAY